MFAISLASVVKRVLVSVLSYEIEISFTCKVNSFSYQWFLTRPRFDKEAITELGYRKS